MQANNYLTLNNVILQIYTLIKCLQEVIDSTKKLNIKI
jgi:hypothetical protein